MKNKLSIFTEKIAQSPETYQMLEVIQFCARKGWTPATTSNFSYRANWVIDSVDSSTEVISPIVVTRSGLDKEKLTEYDFTAVDMNGDGLEPGIKPSAETKLHASIYRHFKNANVVLHCHSPFNTILSRVYVDQGYIEFENYEILKALEGITTHKTSAFINIFHNSQDMVALSKEVDSYFESLKKNDIVWGFLLSAHGIYAWGNDFDSAKRHLETYEFLFQCKALKLQIKF